MLCRIDESGQPGSASRCRSRKTPTGRAPFSCGPRPRSLPISGSATASVPPVALPLIGKDLGLGPQEKGLALSAFFWTYTAMQIPVGRDPQ